MLLYSLTYVEWVMAKPGRRQGKCVVGKARLVDSRIFCLLRLAASGVRGPKLWRRRQYHQDSRRDFPSFALSGPRLAHCEHLTLASAWLMRHSWILRTAAGNALNGDVSVDHSIYTPMWDKSGVSFHAHSLFWTTSIKIGDKYFKIRYLLVKSSWHESIRQLTRTGSRLSSKRLAKTLK